MNLLRGIYSILRDLDYLSLTILIFVFLAAIYGLWLLFSSLKSIKNNIDNIQNDRHSRIMESLENNKKLYANSLDALSTHVQRNGELIRSQLKEEVVSLKHILITQIANQTKKFIEDFEFNKQLLTNIFDFLNNLKVEIRKGAKNNSNKINELSNTVKFLKSESESSIKLHVDKLNSAFMQKNKAILSGLDMIIAQAIGFNKTIVDHLEHLHNNEQKNSKHFESSLSSLSESLMIEYDNIQSKMTQILNNEKELHKRTKGSFDNLSIQLSKYQEQLHQLDTLYEKLKNLYNKLLIEEENISKQEASLLSMVSRHSQIYEITSEMNQTSKDIFEFMKLYLIQSTLDHFK